MLGYSMKWIIGIDEVGRGPLAGPVTVCAVAIPAATYKKILEKNTWAGLNDSKKLTATTREKWHGGAKLLRAEGVIRIAISSRSAAMIDKKGIAPCIRECIAENMKKVEVQPRDCIVLLDGGLKAPVEYKNQTTIIKGDGSEKLISLASVIAKVTRDRYMITLYKKFPIYHWDKNKGYGTKSHILALKNKGISAHHRTSFLSRIIDI
jgi:ribonuclease HII